MQDVGPVIESCGLRYHMGVYSGKKRLECSWMGRKRLHKNPSESVYPFTQTRSVYRTDPPMVIRPLVAASRASGTPYIDPGIRRLALANAQPVCPSPIGEPGERTSR